jgi:predicted glycosyltransferase
MRIVVDLNHPADVHLFKNFITIMKSRGHNVLVTASEKEVSLELLNIYNFEYINLGNYGKSLVEKMLNIPKLDYRMYKAIKNFNPDIFVGADSIRAPHVASLMGKPSISFDDTEHQKEQHLLYVPFTTKILTSTAFKKDFGKKQIRYNGYHELAYLHPSYFKPNPKILCELGLSENDPYIVIRFVSWDASHDIGQSGIGNRIKIVKMLERYGRVYITSETELDTELEKYKLKASPEKLHDVLYYATLYIGEGATTASECAVLGTHAIYVNTLRLGYTDEEEEKYGLVYNFSNTEDLSKKIVDKALELLKNPNLKQEGKLKREALVKDKIDVTAFMIQFVEQYK